MRFSPEIRIHRATLVIFAALLSILFVPLMVLAADLRVAVMPWNVNGPVELSYLGPALTDMISSRVGSNDMVEIVRKDLTLKAAGKLDMKNIGSKSAVKLGKSLDADFLIYGSVSVLGDSISLDAKLLNVASGKVTPIYSSGIGIASVVKMARTLSNEALGNIRSQRVSIKPDLSYLGKFKAEKKEDDNVVEVNARVAPGALIEERPSLVLGEGAGATTPQPVVVITRKTGAKTLKRRSSNLDGLFVSMTNADLDGDGTDEIFMITHKKLVIANFGIEGLKIIKEFSFPVEVQNIFLSSGDTDRDGKSEVYLAQLVRGKPASVSVKYSRGSYVYSELPGLNYLLRVLKIEGEGESLIGQGFQPGRGFLRKIVKIKKDGDTYSVDAIFKLPKSVARLGLSSFQIFDIDRDNTNELVTLGKRGRLKIYKPGANGRYKEYFRSSKTYGGELNLMERPDNFEDDDSALEGVYYMPTEIKYGDFDLDGEVEIILKKNIAGGFGESSKTSRYYKSGTLERLYWNVALLDEEWKTKDINGYISDFIIADLDGDGTPEVTMLVVDNKSGLLKKDKMNSYLLSYSLQ